MCLLKEEIWLSLREPSLAVKMMLSSSRGFGDGDGPGGESGLESETLPAGLLTGLISGPDREETRAHFLEHKWRDHRGGRDG